MCNYNCCTLNSVTLSACTAAVLVVQLVRELQCTQLSRVIRYTVTLQSDKRNILWAHIFGTTLCAHIFGTGLCTRISPLLGAILLSARISLTMMYLISYPLIQPMCHAAVIFELAACALCIRACVLVCACVFVFWPFKNLGRGDKCQAQCMYPYV